MTRILLVLPVFFALVACSGNRELQNVPLVEDATIQQLFVASARGQARGDTRYGIERTREIEYLEYSISVPPMHEPGQVEWPSGTVNPTRHFGVLSQNTYADATAFGRAVARSGSAPETFVFVHGFNTNHAEAVYRAAQMIADFEVPGPGVLFSWPSAGRVSAYVYDRDSVLVSRDDLATLLGQLSQGGRRVALVGHSMGSHLIMEALRAMAKTGNRRAIDRIAAVVLISPDLDVEVFRAQADAIEVLPQPFYIVGTPQDRALRLSGFLTGTQGRLGSLNDARSLADLNVQTLDLTEFADGSGGDHSVLLTSPTAIAIVNALNERYDLMAPPTNGGAVLLENLLPGAFKPIVEGITDPG